MHLCGMRRNSTHLSLLLTGYDCITWGGTPNKLHFIQKQKQLHIMQYGWQQSVSIHMEKGRITGEETDK